MRRSFSLPRISFKNTTSVLQAAAGVLLAANLVAGWFVVRPLGGSADELSGQAAGLRTQIAQRRIGLDRTRLNVVKVENGRTTGDQFMQGYFLTRRTAASTILGELTAAAREAHIRVKLHSFNEEPIEGSDDLSMMVITGEYEGNYGDLIEYVNRIDRSPRLLIIESLSATPQQGTQGVLNISIKFDTFVREDDGMPVVQKDLPETVSDVAPQPSAAARPQQAPIMNVQPVLPRPVPVQPQPQPQPAQPQPAPAPVAVTPTLVPPPPRPRLPMRMQMQKRPSEADDEDQANPRAQAPEEQPEQNQPEQNQPEQNQDQNQNQNPNPPQDNKR